MPLAKWQNGHVATPFLWDFNASWYLVQNAWTTDYGPACGRNMLSKVQWIFWYSNWVDTFFHINHENYIGEDSRFDKPACSNRSIYHLAVSFASWNVCQLFQKFDCPTICKSESNKFNQLCKRSSKRLNVVQKRWYLIIAGQTIPPQTHLTLPEIRV